MKKIVEVKELQKSFGPVQALKDVSFHVGEGEVVGFIGPNGAGKSTTIRVLLGMIQRSGGEAKIFGKDVWQEQNAIHRRVSYVPGDVSLWGNLTGGEIIDVLMALHGGGDPKRREALIERFELDPGKKAKTYSKGNRQKVGLIAALAVDSDLYLFDEPTSGLDPLMEQIFQEEVKGLKERGKSVLLSSHILSEVERLADRVVIIRQGEIVEEGSLSELRHLTQARVTLAAKGDVGVLANFEGVHDFSLDEGQASFALDQDRMNDLLRKASQLEVTQLQVVPPTLEELFMRHYERD